MDWKGIQVPVVKAYPRSMVGSSESRYLRRHDLIPCMIFDRHKRHKMIHIQIHRTELDGFVTKRHFLNKVYELDVQGIGKFQVVPRQLHTHPVNRKAMHVSFMKWKPGYGVACEMPLAFDNLDHLNAVREGGIYDIFRYSVPCRWCGDENIPEFLYVDASQYGGNSGDIILVKDLDIPVGLTVKTSPNEPLIRLRSPHEGESIEDREKRQEAKLLEQQGQQAQQAVPEPKADSKKKGKKDK